MRIDILTLFPEMFKGVFSESIARLAQEKKLVEIKLHNLRKWTTDRHRTVDDKPYGGGPGMVMKVEPVDKGIKELKDKAKKITSRLVALLTPQGEQFTQKIAKRLASYEHLILISGHYEGFDERIRSLVDMEISIGDYVLTCGEIPAMVVSDAVIRLVPGVIGNSGCLMDESFEENLLEYPQYTRPREYKNMHVPEILISGNQKKIEEWRKEEALVRTKARRPDLLKGVE